MAEPPVDAREGEARAEIVRLNKIIQALMNRAERSTEVQGSDFTLFETAIMLEERVRARTVELEAALAEKERVSGALRKSEAQFAAIFNMTPDPIALTRLSDGVVVEASRSFTRYFGLDAADVVGRATLPGDLDIWVSAEERQGWREMLERAGEVVGLQAQMRRRDGSQVTVLVSSRVFEAGGEQYVVTDIHDISVQARRAAYLEGIASHDPLTGLPNRLLIADRLAQAIGRSRRSGLRVAVCYLDLDGFKEINDTLGHAAGDRVLVEVARRLRLCVRSGDTVARLGGDEFVVLLTDLVDDNECVAALDRLLASFGQAFDLDGQSRGGISASIGITVFPTDQGDPDTLIRHADHAMYTAKQAGKNRYHLFDTSHEQRQTALKKTLQHLREALARGEFCLYYQPQVDCRLGKVVGFEALIRWRHPRLGLMPPAEFIPLIEDTELAAAFGEWVIGAVLAQSDAWRRVGVELQISVNIFIRHLLEADFSRKLAAMLNGYPWGGRSLLQLELVETAALKELNTVRAVVEECRQIGIAFSLDDFGTGYSTLAHLRHLPADEIKIDRSFVAQMLESAEDRVIVEAVIGLSQAFGRSLVAEGAETTAHVGALLALGCNIVQGYAVARPMPAEDVLPWLRGFQPDPGWQPLHETDDD